MNRTIVGMFTVLLVLAASGSAHAQIKVVMKPAPAVGANEYVVYTWTSSWGLRDDPPDKYPLGINTHKSRAAAIAAAQAAIDRTKGNGDLAITHFLIEGEPEVRNNLQKYLERVEQAKELIDRLKEAKEAVDHAKEVAKGEASVFKASERKLGDTIKEYKEMLRKSLDQIMETKKTMTKGVAGLTEAKMRQVNGLIDKYNRGIEDYKSVMGSGANPGFSPLPHVQPTDAQKARAEIVGTWNGVSVQGTSRLSIVLVFNSDGTVSNRAENGRTGNGTWSRQGDTISVTWSTGVTVSWQLRDGAIGGSGTTSRGEAWSISFRKQ